MKHCYAFLLLIINLFCYSQATIVWDKTYDFGTDVYVLDVKTTKDGGFVMAGTWNQYEIKRKIFLAKINAQGDTLWSKKFGESKRNTYGTRVIQTKDKGFMIVGVYDRSSYMVKTDSLGNVEWEQTFDLIHPGCSNNLYSIEQTSDGGYLIGGNSEFYEPNWGCHDDNYVATVAKLDSTGKFQWSYQSESHDGYKIEYSKEIAKGKYVIGGDEDILGSDKKAITLLDSIGNVIWRTGYNGYYMISEFQVNEDTLSFCEYYGTCFQFNLNTGDSISQFELFPHEGDGFGKVLLTNNSIITTEYFYQDNSRTFNKFNEQGELQWSIPIENWPVVRIATEWPTIVSSKDSTYVIGGHLVNENKTIAKPKLIKMKESPSGIFDNNPPPSSEVKVYPNPFNDKANVEISPSLFGKLKSVKVLSMQGEILQVLKPETLRFNLDAYCLLPGTYLLEIVTETQNIYKKIIVKP